MESHTATRRRLAPEVRREQVLDAALRLIGRDGYAPLSVEGVAREAGVSKTIVYNAYGGLGPVLAALLEREERAALLSLAEAAPSLPPGADPGEALTAWLTNLAHAVAANPVTWRLMLIPPDGTPEIVRDHVRRGRDVAVEQARALVQGIFAGRPELAGIEVELAARSVVALAEEAGKLLLDQPDEFPPERVAAFAAAVIAALRR